LRWYSSGVLNASKSITKTKRLSTARLGDSQHRVPRMEQGGLVARERRPARGARDRPIRRTRQRRSLLEVPSSHAHLARAVRRLGAPPVSPVPARRPAAARAPESIFSIKNPVKKSSDAFRPFHGMSARPKTSVESIVIAVHLIACAYSSALFAADCAACVCRMTCAPPPRNASASRRGRWYGGSRSEPHPE
jgi:hypothetical protein